MKKEMQKTMLGVGIAGAITLVIAFVVRYFAIPAVTLNSVGMWWFVGLAVIAVFTISITIFAYAYDEDPLWVISKICWGLLGAEFLTMIILGIGSSRMVNSMYYKDIRPVEKVDSFQSDFSDIIQESTPIAIVDLETAQIVGKRTIGNIEHAAWYEIDDEFNLIKYQGKYYRISPLNYGGLFKYNRAEAFGIPGYVLVDAETGKSQYCRVDGGFYYSPSAFWGKDLNRYLRSKWSSKLFDTSYFEIDEEGNPYWITPVYQTTIGAFGGKQEKSVIITDAITGSTQEYSIQELPSWVDHSFSLSYLMQTLQDHYRFVNGYWNACFSSTGVYNTSYSYRSSKSEEGYFEGYTSVIGSDGEIYFYVGLTPANNAESNYGFCMVNTRTGLVKEYNYQVSNAAEESSAQGAVESLVQNFGYQATFPIIVNVNGEETYLMTLKDKAGLVQRYAFCNIQNYSVVVENETFDGALDEYLQKIGGSTTISEPEEAEKKTVQGIIEAKYSAEIDGTTYFYYKLKNRDLLFKSSIKLNENQVILDVGDRVKIEYIERDIPEVTSISFS